MDYQTPSTLSSRELDPMTNIDDAELLRRINSVRNSGFLDMMMNAAFGPNTVEVVNQDSILNLI